jgi:hypothetical protein
MTASAQGWRSESSCMETKLSLVAATEKGSGSLWASSAVGAESSLSHRQLQEEAPSCALSQRNCAGGAPQGGL